MTPLQLKVLDDTREFLATTGLSPSIREVAKWNGLTIGQAHVVVSALVDAGLLQRTPKVPRSLRPADQPDLRGVPSDVLSAELARRGVVLGALNPKAPTATGQQRSCAADSCGAAVQRGHLMCREHWLALPITLRDQILRAHSARDEIAFERAVTRARDLIDSGDWRRRA